MAKEYIEREAVLMGVMRAGCMANTVQALMDIPAADVVEVKRGLWIAQDSSYTRFMCSECNSVNHHIRWDFCPLCGASMRERRTDDG